MIYEVTNAFYFKRLNVIGGTESHLYYIAKKYHEYDIAVFYSAGSSEQVMRLSEYVKVYQIKRTDRVKCKNLFVAYNRDILDIAEAENTYMVLHANYKEQTEKGLFPSNLLPVDSRFNKYLAVSKTVAKGWEELTGIKADVVYEPVVLDEIERPLLFVSATRLSKEKGWDNMVALAEKLDKEKVNYLWMVFTDKTPDVIPPNMAFIRPRRDITDKLGVADAYIQLSHSEAYCLSVVEALKRGVPIIATDLPVFHEIRLNEENSYLIKDINDIDIEKIKGIRNKRFTYQEPKDKFGKYISKVRSKYEREIKVRATKNYQQYKIFDTQLKRVPKMGEEWTVSETRLKQIEEYEKIRQIKLVEEVEW